MKLYLAGPISGFPEHKAAFDAAKGVVTALGYEPISPLDIYPGDNWIRAMQADVQVLIHADGIVLLPGWPKSKGAVGELNLAVLLDKRVFFLVEDQIFEHTHPRDILARIPRV